MARHGDDGHRIVLSVVDYFPYYSHRRKPMGREFFVTAQTFIVKGEKLLQYILEYTQTDMRVGY